MTPETDATAEKYLALMQVSSVIASHRDLAELFDALTECLHQLLGFHYLMVALHDGERHVMRFQHGRERNEALHTALPLVVGAAATRQIADGRQIRPHQDR